MMNCREIENLLDGYFDGELDLVRNLEIENHLESCTGCRKQLTHRQALRTSLKASSLYYEAPADLQARVRQALGKQGETDRSWKLPTWRWTGWAAPALVFTLALFLVAPRLSTSGRTNALTDEIVSAHVRSLMVSHLTDVTSTNQHTVKPWFNGKLDFSPLVKDYAEDAFPLVGGRLDYLSKRSVAALVYRHNQHLINVFTWPAPQDNDQGAHALTRTGYNIIHWTKGGMNYWVISDLNPTELQQFAQLVQSQLH